MIGRYVRIYLDNPFKKFCSEQNIKNKNFLLESMKRVLRILCFYVCLLFDF